MRTPKNAREWIVVVVLAAVIVWVPTQWWRNQMAQFPKPETEREELSRLRSEAQAEMLQSCSNRVVGISHVVTVNLSSYDADPAKWTGEVTVECVNRIGGIERTNLSFTFSKENWPDERLHVHAHFGWRRESKAGGEPETRAVKAPAQPEAPTAGILGESLTQETNAPGPEGIAKLEEAAHKDPQNSNVWFQLGMAFQHRGEFDKELVTARHMTEQWPSDPNAWYCLASVYAYQREWEKLMATAKRMTEQWPKNPHGWNLLGNAIYANANKDDAAVAAWRKAIELDPNYASPWYNLGRYHFFAEQKPQSAIEALNRAIKIQPTDQTWLILGLCYRDESKLDDALQAYRSAIKMNPSNDYAWVCLHGLLLKQRRVPEAIAALQEGVRNNPTSTNLQALASDLPALATLAKRSSAAEELVGALSNYVISATKPSELPLVSNYLNRIITANADGSTPEPRVDDAKSALVEANARCVATNLLLSTNPYGPISFKDASGAMVTNAFVTRIGLSSLVYLTDSGGGGQLSGSTESQTRFGYTSAWIPIRQRWPPGWRPRKRTSSANRNGNRRNRTLPRWTLRRN